METMIARFLAALGRNSLKAGVLVLVVLLTPAVSQGSKPAERSKYPCGAPFRTPCRLGSRRYGRFGNLRYARERWPLVRSRHSPPWEIMRVVWMKHPLTANEVVGHLIALRLVAAGHGPIAPAGVGRQCGQPV